MTSRIRLLLLAGFGASLGACLLTPALAQQPQTDPGVWFRARLNQLTVIEGEIPKPPDKFDYRQRSRRMAMMPRIVIDGDGEAFIGPRVGLMTGKFQATWYQTPGTTINSIIANSVVFHAPSGAKVTGTIYLPKNDWSAMSAVRFEVDSAVRDKVTATEFDNVKRRYYAQHRNLGGAGTAWFRHQCLRGGTDLSTKSKWNDRYLFGLITGARSYGEKMQLNQISDEQLVVKADSIQGVQLPQVEWPAVPDAENLTIGPLAKLIPADQHTVFLSDFSKLIQLIDEVNTNDTLLDIFSSRVEQDLTLPHYERQLCLKLDAASRAFGGTLAKSIAVTGSDLELQMGTDIAILFESTTPQILLAATTTKQQAVKAETANCETDNGTIGDVAYFGVKTTDRAVSSYAANVNGTVVVTNSLVQLERIVETSAGNRPAMAELDEYKTNRSRYPVTNPDETVFLMVPGQAITRWLSPQWRIAGSRRLRAAAVLADTTAENMDALVAGTIESKLQKSKWRVAGLDQLSVSKDGIQCPTYGNMRFLTPIVELDRELVTESEKTAYNSWRTNFEKGYSYSQTIQPVGISLSFKKRKVTIDASANPLKMNYQLRRIWETAGDVSIGPDSGDRHRGTMLSVTYAIDPSQIHTHYSFLKSALGPLDWVGDSFSIVCEHDPAWLELADAWEKSQPANLSRLPVYFRMEVDSPDGAAASEQRLIGLLKMGVDNYLTIEDATYKGVRYTKCIAKPGAAAIVNASELIVSFGSTDRSFIITTNDKLMRKNIDRDLAIKKAKDEGKPIKPYGKPWIGKSVAARADVRLMDTFSGLYLNEYRSRMQARSWSNLTILNEWKTRYPDKDAVKLHANVWAQIVRCPGGGTYQWNEEFQTYESTVYGHPAKPRVGPNLPKRLQSIERIDFGLTFKNKGLHLKTVIDRDPNSMSR